MDASVSKWVAAQIDFSKMGKAMETLVNHGDGVRRKIIITKANTCNVGRKFWYVHGFDEHRTNLRKGSDTLVDFDDN